MRASNRGTFPAALRATVPVMAGYLPLGAAFGLLFSELGYHWAWASAMALLVFAGSAQFLAVGLLGANAGLLETGVAVFLLNARHLFYGFSMLGRYAESGRLKPYLVFGLTDETYALLCTGHPPSTADARRFYLYVTGLNQFYWVLGCTSGALAGGLHLNVTGLDFALTALFVVLLVEQALAVREWYPFLVAGSAGVAALAIVGPDKMLLAALTITLVVLIVSRRPAWVN